MRTFASGRSNDVSPTYGNEAAVCLGRFSYMRRQEKKTNQLASHLNKLCRYFRKAITTLFLCQGPPMKQPFEPSAHAPESRPRDHRDPQAPPSSRPRSVWAANSPRQQAPSTQTFCEWLLFFATEIRLHQTIHTLKWRPWGPAARVREVT